jgi:putative transposase
VLPPACSPWIFGLVADDAAQAELRLDLDELFREGARRMLAVALEAEVDAYIAAYAAVVDERGHRLVRRNGHAPARTIAAGVGQVEVVRPRVDDRRVDPATGQRQQFQSMILPRWVRRSPKVAAVLPLLYLHGLSSSDFVPALTELLGSAVGLSASVITRLTTQWQAEREAFQRRDLSEVDYVYCWADGVHFSIRLGEQGRLCCLVIVGVRADGRKELVAVADGTRESTDDWAELLRDLRRRGMRAPVVMVGDGALGLWRALREVFPATREQRCWVHVTRNVLGALPQSVQASARRALNEIILAEDRTHAERAIDAFAADYGVKWPKAVAKITSETERLLCFFDFPAEHWVHLRTTNPIESSFSPVRARTRVTKGPGTRDTGLAMVFKLLQVAEGRWRAVNGPHLVALVRAGARFEGGKLIERPDERPDKEAAEDVTKVAA